MFVAWLLMGTNSKRSLTFLLECHHAEYRKAQDQQEFKIQKPTLY